MAIRKFRSSSFNYKLDFKNTDFKKHPELYQVGRGEQGVLLVEPYKSEILPFWKFKNPEVAAISADKIYHLFLNYLSENDFVGADMARKFLQMGYTRSRRYTNHAGGRKYARNPQLEATPEAEKEARKEILPYINDPVKAASAEIFKEKWKEAEQNDVYIQLKSQHRHIEISRISRE